MPLLEQNLIDVKRIFSDEENKGEVGRNNGRAKLESPYRDVIGNPEKGRNMNKEDIDVFEYVFIIRIQNHLQAPYRGHDVQGKGGKLSDGIQY
jgi:hypothetical protein